MALVKIKCEHCKSEKVVKYGKNPKGKQRLKCKDCGKTFQEDYTALGRKTETKEMIIKMSVNGSGIRDISRVLRISSNTVLSVLKKQKILLLT